MHASELWQSKGTGARLARSALLPFSWAYAAGWEMYLALYRSGLKQASEPHHPVVCIGNLQVGGSGKTPVTLKLARHLTGAGHEVTVSSSGYGSPRAERASLAPEGELSASEWGDEAAMLRWFMPELQLVVGRDRVLAAQIAHERMPKGILLLDDGFQHLPLKKHLSLVLDPVDPANSHCLPAGPYREPSRNRKRADLLIPDNLTIRYSPLRLVSPTGLRPNLEAPTRSFAQLAIRPDFLLI